MFEFESFRKNGVYNKFENPEKKEKKI